MTNYHDTASTAPISEPVKQAIVELLGKELGNPSSAHAWGREARACREKAREQVAGFVSAQPQQVIFTSSGSESNTQVIYSAVKHGIKRIITTSVEHASMKSALASIDDSIELIQLDVDRLGKLHIPENLTKLIDQNTLVSIQWVNNETGLCFPIEELSALTHQYGGLFHTDLSQGLGKLPFHFESSQIDFAILTGHKVHAPAGIAALLVRDHHRLEPLIRGGDQEYGLRGGTENLIGIVALGAALESWQPSWSRQIEQIRDRFEEELRLRLQDRVEFIGASYERAPHISSVRFVGVEGLALFAQLIMHGVCVSQGSACTTGRPEPSAVLTSMGFSEEEAYEIIRFSFSHESVIDDKLLTLITNLAQNLS